MEEEEFSIHSTFKSIRKGISRDENLMLAMEGYNTNLHLLQEIEMFEKSKFSILLKSHREQHTSSNNLDNHELTNSTQKAHIQPRVSESLIPNQLKVGAPYMCNGDLTRNYHSE